MTTNDKDCRPEFEAWLASCGRSPLMWNTSDAMLAAWTAATRAALATRPAAGEPIRQWADQDLWMDGDEADMASARAEGFKTRTLWTAPPAAAHGDEAVRKDAAVAAIQYALKHQMEDPIEFLYRWNEGDFESIRNEWKDVPEEVFIGADPLHPATITAMRAQGDGEVQ
jgi:hypothetical protein